jgi:cell division protein FtsB
VTRGQKIKAGLALAVMICMLVLIFFGENGLVELFRKRDEYRVLENANRLLIQDNAKLYRMVDRLNNDLSYVEEVARKELGMVRSDELIFTFVSKPDIKKP